MNAKPKADLLAEALALFRKERRLLVLSTAPEYPEYLVIVGSEDSTEDETWLPSDLLRHGFEGRPNIDPEWTLLAKTQSRWGRSAVYEYEPCSAEPSPLSESQSNKVFQITNVVPKRQSTSVVGRIGAVEILAKKLRAALFEIDRSLRDELSIADLAILATRDRPEKAEGLEKLLRRANRGSYITERKLETAGRALCVESRELAFSHPSIYDQEAKQRRRKDLKRRSQGRLDKLAVYPVKLERLAVDRPDLMARVVQLQKAGLLEFRSMLSGAQQLKERAVATFTNAVFGDPNAVGGALVALHAAGLNAWFGEYDDRQPIGRHDTDFSIPFEVRAKTVRKGIVSFRELSLTAPPVTVDLSHTAALGPTLEDLEAQLT